MLKRWAWSSVVMVVRDPRRPGMFMCVDGWHRCQAGELLERSGYLKEIPCRLLAHLTDSEMTL
eukprot:scaffold157802_cov12-Tisochrysis_lutea.AAC.1